jgi:large subunit ribosomal protein L15
MNLPRLVSHSKKRIGRGHGSGKGKTGGRGQKGQKAREKIRYAFEGGQKMLHHRLPLLRGKGRNRSQRYDVHEIQVKQLEKFANAEEVNLKTLEKKGLILMGTKRVKIIGNDTLNVSLTVHVPVTKGAKLAIEKAGGTIVA